MLPFKKRLLIESIPGNGVGRIRMPDIKRSKLSVE